MFHHNNYFVCYSHVDVSYNNILHLNKNLICENFDMVEEIDFSFNNMESIEFDSLIYLKILTKLNISNNLLNNIHLDVQKNEKLIELDLSNNFLGNDSLIELNQNLETLSINNCQINSLNIIHPLYNLKNIYARSNKISSIPHELINNMKMLSLDLTNNCLKTLSPNLFNFFLNLEKIELTNNSFNELDCPNNKQIIFMCSSSIVCKSKICKLCKSLEEQNYFKWKDKFEQCSVTTTTTTTVKDYTFNNKEISNTTPFINQPTKNDLNELTSTISSFDSNYNNISVGIKDSKELIILNTDIDNLKNNCCNNKILSIYYIYFVIVGTRLAEWL